MKKLEIILLGMVSLLNLVIGPFVADTRATSEPIGNSLADTGWKISGSFTVAIKFPNFVEFTSKVPKLETYWNTFGVGEAFYFRGDGIFEDLILSVLPSGAGDPGIGIALPTWTQSGSNFVIDVSEFSQVLAERLQSALGDMAVINRQALRTPSFYGKIDSTGASISGKLSVKYNLSSALRSGMPIDGTVSLTMNFKGTSLQSGTISAWDAFNAASFSLGSKARSEETTRLFSAIKNAVADIKAQDPQGWKNLLSCH